MATYIVERAALEHRCQCCGELADTVFCGDCEHPGPATGEGVRPDAGLFQGAGLFKGSAPA